MCYNNTMHIKRGGGAVDRKAYLAKLHSQNKRERSFASLGLTCSGRDLAIAFGLYLAAVVDKLEANEKGTIDMTQEGKASFIPA